MNAFILHTEPEQAARWHVDRHVVKLPIEASQILCTAFWNQGIDAPMKKTHFNHPVCKFARASCLNFEWIVEYGKALCDEYTARYGRRHASQDVIEWCDKNAHNLSFDQFSQTDFAIAISLESKCRQVEGFDSMSAVQKYSELPISNYANSLKQVWKTDKGWRERTFSIHSEDKYNNKTFNRNRSTNATWTSEWSFF